MPNPNRVAGPFYLKIDGKIYNGKGNFTFSGQKSTRSSIPDSKHDIVGYSEAPKTPFIEGVITDTGDLDVENELWKKDGIEAVTLELANGKIFALSPAWFAGESDITTEMGEIPVRWEGKEGTFTS